MSGMIPVLGGNIAKRTLQFFWIADCSGSMTGKKMHSLNRAIREALPEIRSAVSAHPEVQIMMRAIKFSDEASWHIGPQPQPFENFSWIDLQADGLTATAQAIDLLSGELEVEKMNRRGYPPVCILLSDGFSTDDPEAYESAIAKLNSMPWGKRAVRLVIAIGDEREYDEEALLKFVSHKEIGVLKADTPEKLTAYIKWASVTASIGASIGKSRTGSALNGNQNVVLSAPPQVTVAANSGDEDIF